jgi:hypothetical protein
LEEICKENVLDRVQNEIIRKSGEEKLQKQMKNDRYGLEIFFVEPKIRAYIAGTGMESSRAPEKGQTTTYLEQGYNGVNEGAGSVRGRCRILRDMETRSKKHPQGKKKDSEKKIIHACPPIGLGFARTIEKLMP